MFGNVGTSPMQPLIPKIFLMAKDKPKVFLKLTDANGVPSSSTLWWVLLMVSPVVDIREGCCLADDFTPPTFLCIVSFVRDSESKNNAGCFITG